MYTIEEVYFYAASALTLSMVGGFVMQEYYKRKAVQETKRAAGILRAYVTKYLSDTTNGA